MSHSSQETPDYGVLVCRSSLFTRPADGAQKRHYCGQCRNLSVSLEEFGLGAPYCFEVGVCKAILLLCKQAALVRLLCALLRFLLPAPTKLTPSYAVGKLQKDAEEHKQSNI